MSDVYDNFDRARNLAALAAALTDTSIKIWGDATAAWFRRDDGAMRNAIAALNVAHYDALAEAAHEREHDVLSEIRPDAE
jgi:L-alanine-DL-glutamate epimerase-like enolase superfamily enzyme